MLQANKIMQERKNSAELASLKKPLRILIVTGGSKDYPASFLEIFNSMKGMQFDTLSQPRANEALLSDTIGMYDAFVFYDMTQKITEAQKEGFIELTKKGKGLVFLHHSLVSYQEWDNFRLFIGGKYYEKKFKYPAEKISSYKHDLQLNIKVLEPGHPINKGISDFYITDEGYSNIEVLSSVTPLLSTKHPDCTDIVAWTNQYNNSGIVYILLGHDDHAYSNENYRKLINNAIHWSVKNK